MRIGLNLLYLLPGIVGGTETYASSLLEGLGALDSGDEFVVFLNLESKDWPLPPQDGFKRIICRVRARSRIARYFFEQSVLPGMLRRYGIDVVHSLGYVGPLVCPCPSIVTIPDLNYLAFGNQMPALRRLSLKLFVEQSARRATHVITISDFAHQEIIQHLKIDHDKVQTIHLAPPQWLTRIAAERCDRLATSESPTIIAFASESPNKNIFRLIEAFSLVRVSHGVSAKLILIGHLPSGGALTTLVQDLGLTDSVTFTGHVDKLRLYQLLRSSSLLVFPSTYEGFGLPVLEAMTLGVPVVCSNAASLPEVAGDAALYFDPLSIDEMAAALAKVALDERLQDDLRQRGFHNVQRYSWERTARETLQAYKRVLRTCFNRPE